LWDFVPRNDALVENEIDTVELRFPKKRSTVFFNRNMLALNRGGLDKYAAKLAEEAGAKIKTGHRAVKIISLGRSRPHLVAENGGRTVAQEFDRIIGCDGANSVVRKYARAKTPSFRIGLYAVLKRRSKKNSVEVSPTENGFKWKIPRGETTEVGALERPERVKKIFRRAKTEVFSAIIPEGLSLSKDKRFMLCGDAAGLTKPWSGGGIIWGMTAADLLADSKLDTARYNRRLERHFGPKIFFSKLARKAVYFAGKHAPFLIPKRAHMDSDWLY
jgi:flavin-dependent dehydrogenase